MPLGLYISVPFCRSKCSYCNFASGVFARDVYQRYVDRVCSDIGRLAQTAEEMGALFEHTVDSVYLGGGTPTILDIEQLAQLFVTISQNFDVAPDAEITVECAPGTLGRAMLEALLGCGVNRISLGVQSFVHGEAASVGRQHNRATVDEDIARLRSAGISNINLDLIAGLPHQNLETWQVSVTEAIRSGAPHLSVYMLEVDEDSRLGRELIAGGTRYHAHFVPDEDVTVQMYETACERLSGAGVHQWEISNFARLGFESRHNLKYWTRQPYLGFGVDAHSMLPTENNTAVRFATPDSLDAYLNHAPLRRTSISRQAALEETFFLGLRLTRGLDLPAVVAEFGEKAVAGFSETIREFVEAGLLSREGPRLRLSARGRLLSNEVFERFLCVAESETQARSGVAKYAPTSI
jgi:oxygen-independent coproporphyrinogen III oxidase